MLRISLKEAMTEVLYDKNRKYVNNASRAFDLVWSLKDFSRLTTATSSQSPLGHDSRRRHPPSSDLKVPIRAAQVGFRRGLFENLD